MPTTARERAILYGAFIASIAWQLYIVAMAFRHVQTFSGVFASLGAELPAITRALFLTYRGWIVVPVIFTVLAGRAIRSESSSPLYLGVLVALSVSAGFAMQGWLYEGTFGPMMALLRQLG